MSSRLLNQQVIGGQVRHLRTQSRLSVRSFATRTGFSASFISQVEQGQVSPSIGSMEKIAEALGVTLGEFFSGVDGGEDGQFVRVADRRGLASSWSNAVIEAVRRPGSPMEAVIVTLMPGGRSGKRPRADARGQFALVLENAVTLTLGAQRHSLRKGDAVSILPQELRMWENPGRRVARILVVSLVPGPSDRVFPRP
jgi:XRE family transcriptional regulator, regulator of sulfur utilization